MFCLTSHICEQRKETPVFHIRTEMPILAFLSLLCENKKKISDKMLPPVGIEPGPLIASDSKSNALLSTLTLDLLVRLRL